MGAHGLRGGREGLDRVHHGLGGHHGSPGLRERDGERHLHDPVGDGHDGSRVHDGGHGRCVGDVHVHTILQGEGRQNFKETCTQTRSLVSTTDAPPL